jgi:D-glycero-D-manno-heptose 1,7-bisphosphate phosphatase
MEGSEQGTPGYLTEPEQLELIKNADSAIASARQAGYKIIVITNQSAVARGLLTEEDLHEINRRMCEMLLARNPSAVIDDIYYSPYHIEGIIEKYTIESPMRKPDIGMVVEAQEKHNIDLAQSYFIGDSYADMKCGDNAGTKKILVMTGYGKIAHQKCLDEKLKIDFIAENLLDAVNYVCRSERSEESHE